MYNIIRKFGVSKRLHLWWILLLHHIDYVIYFMLIMAIYWWVKNVRGSSEVYWKSKHSFAMTLEMWTIRVKLNKWHVSVVVVFSTVMQFKPHLFEKSCIHKITVLMLNPLCFISSLKSYTVKQIGTYMNNSGSIAPINTNISSLKSVKPPCIIHEKTSFFVWLVIICTPLKGALQLCVASWTIKPTSVGTSEFIRKLSQALSQTYFAPWPLSQQHNYSSEGI